jgi:hypothetical protein
MKDFTLVYWDRRLAEQEVIACLEQAWNELYDMEYDGAFGAWRGVHFDPEADAVHITWDTMYAGPPLMISIFRASGQIKMDFPRDEFLLLEEEEMERLRNLPPGKR